MSSGQTRLVAHNVDLSPKN
ncbi:hypothetical protein [Moritella sp. JT01]